MKIKLTVLLLLFLFFACENLNESPQNPDALRMSAIPKMSGIFVGEGFYKERQREQTLQELRESGFTMVEISAIHLLEDGKLDFNMEFPIVADGKYIGDKTHPQFKNDVASLKQDLFSSITKINFGLEAEETFDNIKSLIESGSGDILYRSFKALKKHFPDVDAINFHDGMATYDLESASKFAIILTDIGFKVAIVPYNANSFQDFWVPLGNKIKEDRPDFIDAVYLQCYANGNQNGQFIGNWQFLLQDVPVYPGMDTARGVSAIEDQLKSWKYFYGTRGAWLWQYDQIPDNAARHARALRQIFKITL